MTAKRVSETPGDQETRVTAPALHAEDVDVELSVRPTSFDDFVGQAKLKDNLQVFIEAARGRGEALDHVLFYGPPGLGKTTLAHIIAREMGVAIKCTSGPVLERAAFAFFRGDSQRNRLVATALDVMSKAVTRKDSK